MNTDLSWDTFGHRLLTKIKSPSTKAAAKAAAAHRNHKNAYGFYDSETLLFYLLVLCGFVFVVLALLGFKFRQERGYLTQEELKDLRMRKETSKGARAKRASLEEDEHTHDGSREMAADGYIHY